MTVGELIERLKALPPEARALVDGRDDCGFDDLRLKSADVHPCNIEWGLGQYEQFYEDPSDDSKERIAAVLFERDR